MYYFDNAATTQPLPEVMTTHQQVAMEYFANPSSIHQLGERSRDLLSAARQQIADLLEIQATEVYFTASGTESNNWVMTGIVEALATVHPQHKTILISAIEHPSVMKQTERLVRLGFNVQLIPVTHEGHIDLNQLERLLEQDVLLISTMAVNNEMGALQPLEQIGQLLKAHPSIAWHVDGVQAVTCQWESLLNDRIDLITLSSHKFHAPRGAGLLMIRERIARWPLLYGGGQEFNLRSGTENVASIVAMAKALRLATNNPTQHRQKLLHFQTQLRDQFNHLGWLVHTPGSSTPHIICASLPPVPGEVIVHALAAKSVYVSTTSACSSQRKSEHTTLSAMQIPSHVAESAIRISLSTQTTEDQINYLLTQLPIITHQLTKEH